MKNLVALVLVVSFFSATAVAGDIYVPRELAVDMVREVAPNQVNNVRTEKLIPVSEKLLQKPEVKALVLRHADPDRSLRELLLSLLLTSD